MSTSPDFVALKDLHNSANDLLHSPMTKKILLRHQHESKKLIHEVSEASLRMLEACGNTKDVLSLVKDHIQQLQSTFRKASNVGEKSPPLENKFGAYYLDRKNLKKQMMKRVNSFKRMKSAPSIIANDVSTPPIDHNLLVVVSVLKEVRETTMSMLESLMLLMAMPSPNSSSQMKSNRRVFQCKLMRVNSLSPWEKCDAKKLQSANDRLEAVEIAMEELEVELECILRRLIKTRVLLLNILTN